MVFAKEMYDEEVQKELNPEIGCSYETWQKLVLQGCVMIHAMNKQGGFYAYNIDYSDWNIYDESHGDSVPYMTTDHVIKITTLWSYVRHELRLLGTEFTSKDPDEDFGAGLERSVLAYVKGLAHAGYVISLNTQMGHADEYSFRLSDTFFEHIDL